MLRTLFLNPASTKIKVLRGVVLLLIVGCLAAAWPTYRALKIWRAHRIAFEAEAVLTANPNQALQKAQAAVKLAPQDQRCLRTMAMILTRLGREEAFRYWDLAAAQGTLSQSDTLQRIYLALGLRRLELAERYLAPELKRPPLSAALAKAAAAVFALKGDNAEAIQTSRLWSAAEPSNLDAKFFLARQLLAAEDATVLPEAKWLLGQVIDARHAEWPQALRTMAYLPDLTPAEIQQCIRHFNMLPVTDPKRDLAMIDLQLRLEPQRKNELVTAAVNYYRTGTTEVVLVLTRWLSQKGEHARVIETISPAQARTDKNLFLVYVDALAAQNQWIELEKLLGEPKLPLEPILVSLYQARVAGELKKDRQKNSHWAQVQWLGSKNPELLWYAAQYAARIGEREEAIKACRRLTEEAPFARRAWVALIRWAQQKGDPKEVRELIAEMTRRYPGDPVPANDLAYLDLLSGQNVTEAAATAQRLVKDYPEFLAYRTTLALAYLRTNNRSAAKAVFQDLNVKWPEVAPGWQAIYAAVLGSSGDTDAARAVARRISGQPLRPGEKALVQPWL